MNTELRAGTADLSIAEHKGRWGTECSGPYQFTLNLRIFRNLTFIVGQGE